MKKILFNGCSFMAGDELVWAQFCLEHNRPDLEWNNPLTPDYHIFSYKYRHNYRKNYNLPALISQILEVDKIDISYDGNSNDMISIETIGYLSKLTPVERQQYHVCIGWTHLQRLMKYSNKYNPKSFYNLHINHIGHNSDNPVLNELDHYIMSAIAKSYNEDFFMNYSKNIMLLENYLIANNITYTFYRSLGDSSDMKNCILGPFANSSFPCIIDKELLSNPLNWYKFDCGEHNHLPPHLGSSWERSIISRASSELKISEKNSHPNMKAIENFSKILAQFIQQQNML